MTVEIILSKAGILPIAAQNVSKYHLRVEHRKPRTNAVARTIPVLQTVGQDLTSAEVDEVGRVTRTSQHQMSNDREAS
jgi:hypothetical protein